MSSNQRITAESKNENADPPVEPLPTCVRTNEEVRVRPISNQMEAIIRGFENFRIVERETGFQERQRRQYIQNHLRRLDGRNDLLLHAMFMEHHQAEEAENELQLFSDQGREFPESLDGAHRRLAMQARGMEDNYAYMPMPALHGTSSDAEEYNDMPDLHSTSSDEEERNDMQDLVRYDPDDEAHDDMPDLVSDSADDEAYVNANKAA